MGISDIEWDGKERRSVEEIRRSTDGTCFLHQDAIKSIEEHIKVQEATSLELSLSMNTAKITNGIMIVIFIGSFLYTYNHIASSERTFELQKQELHRTAELHRALIDNNKEIIQDTRGDYKALLVKLDNLTREIQKSNSQNARLIDALLEGNPQ